MKRIRLLIVDDHPMMREALITAIEEEDHLEVIADAASAEVGLELFDTLQPDLVLMDLLLPGINGIEAITHIVEKHPEARILVITSLENDESILNAIQAGALGYFPKTAPRQNLLDAIQKVADGIPYLPAGIAAKLFKRLRGMELKQNTGSPQQQLTPRQAEIFELMGDSLSDVEIANRLHIEEATVRTHIHNILQRLGLETRAQAVSLSSEAQGERQ